MTAPDGGARGDSTEPDLAARYLDALLRGDRAGAVRVAVDEAGARGLGAARVALDVVCAAQREVGRLWEANRVSVAQEHVATAISQLVLARLHAAQPRAPRNGVRVVVACVAGELHDLGARVAADLLEAEGFDARSLGANVPAARIAAVVAGGSVDALALSATLTFHLVALRDAVRAARDVSPGLPIVCGGGALRAAPGLAAELGVVESAGDATSLAAAVRRAMERR